MFLSRILGRRNPRTALRTPATRPSVVRRPSVESLEGRKLLSGGGGVGQHIGVVADIQGGHIGTNVA